VSNPLPTITSAAGVFAGTNLDDLVVLTALFLAARTQGKPPAWQIVAGQFLGFLGLVLVSKGAAAGLMIVPEQWVGLLGLIPFALGIRGLWRARSHDGNDSAPIASGLLGVASITVANGADNLGVYTPLFRTLGTGKILLTVAVFLVLLALWCAAGALLSSHKKVIDGLEKVGHLLVPVVFIAIGSWILIESGVLTQLL
jgi:cadmium resistance transport/sequestration family protein